MNFDVRIWLLSLLNTTGRYFVIAGIAFLVFYVAFPKYFAKIKIQKKISKTKDYSRDIGYSVISMFIFVSMQYLCFTALKKYNNVSYDKITNIYTYILSFFWMFFLHDTYFYWCHRAMHHPLLFRTIHLIHHKSTNPSPWTSYAFHPIEAVLEAGIIPLVAFTLPVHRSAFFFFMLFQIIYNVYGHLGYELYPKNFNKTKIGRWINTSVSHNQHHKSFSGNYGLYTLFWDRVCGTIRKDYDSNFDAIKSNNIRS